MRCLVSQESTSLERLIFERPSEGTGGPATKSINKYFCILNFMIFKELSHSSADGI
ncbi:hypothetical protein SAMN04488082_1131 [Desulfomicrobium apsheronum]|uniref:Uncharacterized protein n=1 Tax=Desulfomicrobium apsheronum TaxID=52560 RepID=A0A1I3WGC6_9BACT|nr:hypothetical protein SAMN04488082_1131 [Desulfomicrobium apsheronum]